MWRTILELSGMSNNDEFVVHTAQEITHSDLPAYRNLAWGRQAPTLVMSRLVLEAEVTSGLNTSYRGRIVSLSHRNLDENAPPITRTLDELHKLLNQLRFWVADLNTHPHEAISLIISRGFCDGMSGGLSFTTLSALRAIIERHRIPLDLEVDEPTGLTIEAFLKQIEDVPRFEDLLPPNVTIPLLLETSNAHSRH